MNTPSYIRQDYKVMPEICMNALSWIGQGHEAIQIKILAVLRKVMKLY